MTAALRRAVFAACALSGCNEILDNRDFPRPVVDANPIVDCAAMGKTPTTLTGTVFAPNGTLPISNARVYVATTDLADIPDGPSGPTCASGAPIAAAVSDSHGTFELKDVPAGQPIRLVVQVGKWRRAVNLPSVAACSATAVDAELTRLPRTSSEGHIPHIAITTGRDDTLECLARDIGVDPSELSSTGRVRFYSGNGTEQFAGGAAFDPRSALTNSDALKTYDAVLLGCEGRNATAEAAGAQAMFNFVQAGGWLWLTHDAFTWLKQAPAPWATLGTFDAQTALPAPATLLIDKATTHGQAFAGWLDAIGVSTMPGTLDVALALSSCRMADATQTQRVLYFDPSNGTGEQMFTWDGTNSGRLVFSDVHLSGIPQQSAPPPYPQECMPPLAQELAIIYQLFDTPTCMP